MLPNPRLCNLEIHQKTRNDIDSPDNVNIMLCYVNIMLIDHNNYDNNSDDNGLEDKGDNDDDEEIM